MIAWLRPKAELQREELEQFAQRALHLEVRTEHSHSKVQKPPKGSPAIQVEPLEEINKISEK